MLTVSLREGCDTELDGYNLHSVNANVWWPFIARAPTSPADPSSGVGVLSSTWAQDHTYTFLTAPRLHSTINQAPLSRNSVHMHNLRYLLNLSIASNQGSRQLSLAKNLVLVGRVCMTGRYLVILMHVWSLEEIDNSMDDSFLEDLQVSSNNVPHAMSLEAVRGSRRSGASGL